jgi:hypothetical protein
VVLDAVVETELSSGSAAAAPRFLFVPGGGGRSANQSPFQFHQFALENLITLGGIP